MYGQQITSAIELLKSHLIDKEIRAIEIFEIAEKAGISKITLNRAKHIVNAQSRKTSNGWVWYMPMKCITPKANKMLKAQLHLPIAYIASSEQSSFDITESPFDTASANRIFLVCGVSKFYGKFDAFSLRVPRALESNMMVGDAIVFCNWSRDQISILQWQGDGFVQYFKRSDYGHFPWTNKSQKDVSAVEITAEDLKMILEYPRLRLRLSGIITPQISL